MAKYAGHRSWNAWNVSLWMGNDEGPYRFAIRCLEKADWNAKKATELFMDVYGYQQTPDGAIYNLLSVKSAMEAFAKGRTDEK